MATKFAEFWQALAAPIPENEIKERTQGGKRLKWITARTVQIRLDEVAGPEGWWPAYTETKAGLKCALTVVLPDGSAVTKEDGGAAAGMAEADNDAKSAYSDAFKRAAVCYGIGRELYRDGVAEYDGEHHAPAPQQRQPDRREAVVDQYTQHREDRRPQANGNGQGGGGNKFEGRAPTSGKGMFAWTKEQEKQHDVDLLRYLNGWAKLQEFPARMVDWNPEQVGLAYAEGCRKLAAISEPAAAPGGRAEDGRPDYDDSDGPAY